MARILPWNIEREPPPKKRRITPAPRLKQEKIAFQSKEGESEEERPSNGRGRAAFANATPKSSRTYLKVLEQQRALTMLVRTPSSSPVRGPPPAELVQISLLRAHC